MPVCLSVFACLFDCEIARPFVLFVVLFVLFVCAVCLSHLRVCSFARLLVYVFVYMIVRVFGCLCGVWLC